MKITVVPCLRDNYCYIVQDEFPDYKTAVIDPGEAEPVLIALKEQGISPDYILITHHHYDHIAGVEEIKKQFPSCKVAGAAADADLLPSPDILLEPGNKFSFGSENVDILDASGHTEGHIAYFFPESLHLFCGDALFNLGCGRLPDDSDETLFKAWATVESFSHLPTETLIYCGHEYSLQNAYFALAADPDNHTLANAVSYYRSLREDGKPTVPTSVMKEIETNPFIRTRIPAVAAFAGIAEQKPVNPAMIFANLRKMRNTFRTS